MKVLKFGSIGCIGCVVMKPLWAEIEKENLWLATEFIDADENPEKVREWQVKDLPEFIFLDKNGAEIERLMGEVEKEILVKKINELRAR